MLSGTRTLILSVITLTILSACSSGSSGGGGGGDDPPANIAPTASITVTNATGYSPLTVSFDASQSTDPDGTISTYSWDFGDGGSADTSEADHAFTDLGGYTATLTVTDDDGAASTATTTIDVHTQVAGIYFGDFIGNVPGGASTTVLAHVATNQKFYAYEDGSGIGGCRAVYSGDISIDVDLVTSTFLTELLEPFCTFPDGTQVGNVDVMATVVAQNMITGTYVGVGDNGTVQLSYNAELSERGSSLAEISGTWSFSDGEGFTDTMVVEENGDFTSTDTDGCATTGSFSLLDTSLNEFHIEYDLTCPAGINEAGDGLREGIAFVDDIFFVDDWLEWNITFLEGPLAGRQGSWALSRPAAVPATSELGKTEVLAKPKAVGRNIVTRRTR